ncbi:YppG family protein [Virgibacillus sp. C22-A2]|uniref:YppG family protein n=1 Tax=Virgibacillus tibetensis TaxID=3042313 RepID=A0ABU6KI86_9BACI|nr:YppG family protein [Virgibacillus sp. C22-A2]
MFPERPRRPMPPYQPVPRRPFMGPQPQPQSRPGLLSQFQTPEGRLDFEKISATAQQMHGIYNQVSPLISKAGPFITRFIGR